MLKTAFAPALRNQNTVATMKASDRIRHRLTEAGKDFRANDNIADFIEDGELDELRLEVEDRMNEVLRALVIDTDNDHNTPIPRAASPRCSSMRCSPAATRTLPRSRHFPMCRGSTS